MAVKDDFRTLTYHRRPFYNMNNPRRTEYYLSYWLKHPEIPWALLAHLVSRNAGWQMTDLVRFAPLAPKVGVLVTRLYGQAHYQALFAMLEAANFLILEDVYPLLEAYDWAKRYPSESDAIFDALLEITETDPHFEVDPFVWQQLRAFYVAARSSDWFPTWWLEPSVQRVSFALIINEQNQIEDRLVNDADRRYLGSFTGTSSALVSIMNALGFVRLCFPLAQSQADPRAPALLLYEVVDFTQLGDRVNTGRDLFVGLFGDEQRRKLLETWVLANPVHHGTRVDYNPTDYSVALETILPGGQKYSPPLVQWRGQQPAWPLDPSKMPFYSNLHDPPVPLPVQVSARTQSDIARWLSPLAAPVRPLTHAAPGDLAEVIF